MVWDWVGLLVCLLYFIMYDVTLACNFWLAREEAWNGSWKGRQCLLLVIPTKNGSKTPANTVAIIIIKKNISSTQIIWVVMILLLKLSGYMTNTLCYLAPKWFPTMHSKHRRLGTSSMLGRLDLEGKIWPMRTEWAAPAIALFPRMRSCHSLPLHCQCLVEMKLLRETKMLWWPVSEPWDQKEKMLGLWDPTGWTTFQEWVHHLVDHWLKYCALVLQAVLNQIRMLHLLTAAALAPLLAAKKLMRKYVVHAATTWLWAHYVLCIYRLPVEWKMLAVMKLDLISWTLANNNLIRNSFNCYSLVLLPTSMTNVFIYN